MSDAGKLEFEHNIVAPAAGIEFAYTIMNKVTAKLVFLTFVFTTDANVGDRHVHVTREIYGANLYLGAPSVACVANKAYRFYCGTGYSNNLMTTDTHRFVNFPDIRVFPEFSILTTLTTGIQAGDTFTDIRFIFEMWPSP